MKIYTKKGDKGETRMLFGDAVSKDDLAPDAYGSVDELVAALGLIRANTKLPIEVKETVLRIQRELFIVGAELATTKENRKKLVPQKTLVEKKMILKLEEEIDREVKIVESEIKELKKKSPEKINKIAIETSSDLINQLIGANVNNSSITAIVSDIASKNKNT